MKLHQEIWIRAYTSAMRCGFSSVNCNMKAEEAVKNFKESKELKGSNGPREEPQTPDVSDI